MGDSYDERCKQQTFKFCLRRASAKSGKKQISGTKEQRHEYRESERADDGMTDTAVLFEEGPATSSEQNYDVGVGSVGGQDTKSSNPRRQPF